LTLKIHTMKKYYLLLIVGLFVSLSISAQSKKELKEAEAEKQYQEMKNLIESGEFTFIADWATSVRGRRINLTTNANFLKFTKDSIDTYLPYFGESSSGGATMTSDGGIVCSGPKTKYKLTLNDKKKKIMLSFTTTDNNDTFEFSMSIFKEGNTNINVNSNYRTSIKYDGKTTVPKPEKKKP